ncbi:MAG: hypothetical protein PWP62_2290 [Eubacteriaceae bacterium]|nr:hypothetical protein [Eubacteriaceae bacterium]
MTLSKNSFSRIGIAMFLFFTLTVDFRLFVFKNTYIAYVFAILALVLLFYGSSIPILGSVTSSIFLWNCAILFVIPTGNISEITGFLIGLMLLYCYYKTTGAGNYTVKVLFGYGLFYSFFTFFFYAFPDLYTNSIVPLFPVYARNTAINLLNSNCYPGLTAHYSTNGIYLAIGIGALFSIYLSDYNSRQPKQKRKKIILLMLVFMMGALLLTGKRAHLVFTIAGCFFVYWLSYSDNKKGRLLKVVFGLVVASIIFIFVVNLLPGLSNTFRRFSETLESGNFLMGRETFYAASWIQFSNNPIFGCGWKKMMSLIGHDTHNIYIQLLAETGIIGFLLFAGLIAYGVLSATKTLKEYTKDRDRIGKSNYSLLYFSTFYIYFFVLYGMTGNPLYDEQTFYIFMIAYGTMLYYRKKMIAVYSDEPELIEVRK